MTIMYVILRKRGFALIFYDIPQSFVILKTPHKIYHFYYKHSFIVYIIFRQSIKLMNAFLSPKNIIKKINKKFFCKVLGPTFFCLERWFKFRSRSHFSYFKENIICKMIYNFNPLIQKLNYNLNELKSV